MWATRPPLQQHRMNVGESPFFAATQNQCGRVALLCSNTGSMWASRPPLQQHRINVGESPSFAATQINEGDSPSFAATQNECGRVALLCSNTGSMWATRPPLQQHRINVGESPTLLSPAMASTSPPTLGTRCLLDKIICVGIVSMPAQLP